MKIYFLPTVSICIQKKRSRDFTPIMIIKRGSSLIHYQILSTNSVRKCVEISVENLLVDIWGSVLIALCVNKITLLSTCLFIFIRSFPVFSLGLLGSDFYFHKHSYYVHYISFLLLSFSIVHWPQSSLSCAY